MAAAFKLSGIAAANQTETKVVITDILYLVLSLHFLKVDEGKNFCDLYFLSNVKIYLS